MRNILYQHEITIWNRNILHKPQSTIHRQWQGFNSSFRFNQQKNFAALTTGTGKNGRRKAREKEETNDDYRYPKQQDNERNSISSQQYWRDNKFQTKTEGKKKNKRFVSPKMRKGESYTENNNNKGFISFFDEVDARMEKSSYKNSFIPKLDEEKDKQNSLETDNQSLA